MPLVTHYTTILTTLTSLVSKSLSFIFDLLFLFSFLDLLAECWSLSDYHLLIYAPAIVSRAKADVCWGRGKRGHTP